VHDLSFTWPVVRRGGSGGCGAGYPFQAWPLVVLTGTDGKKGPGQEQPQGPDPTVETKDNLTFEDPFEGKCPEPLSYHSYPSG
jgi:hypothetical protein